MRPAGITAALRIARRQTRRAKGRSALVVALVGLPVAALSFGAVTYDSFRPTGEEQATRTMGAADAVVRMLHDEPVMQMPDDLSVAPAPGRTLGDDPRARTVEEMLAVLPPGTTLQPDRPGRDVEVRTADGITELNTRGLDYAAEIAEGILTPVAGRAPANGQEVALTTAAARRIRARVGDRLELVEPERATYRIVGLVEDPGALGHRLVVFLPAALPGGDPRQTSWLADTPGPLSWPDVVALNETGMIAVSRAVLVNPPPRSEVPYFVATHRTSRDGVEVFSSAGVLVGMTVLQVVLLAGPAFAISARRRQREFALVAAAGGTRAQIRWIVLADGVVLGGIGAAAGLAVGVLGTVAALPLLEEHLVGQRIAGLRVFPLALAGVAGLAVVTGVLAALAPAVSAARRDVVAALSGRRGVTRSKRRWVVAGLAITGLGAVSAVYGTTSSSTQAVLAGVVLGELGLVICMPALIGAVAGLGGWLPLSARIALRTTSRNRGAAAPAVAAVMAAVAGAVTIGMVESATTERRVATYRPGMPDGYVSVGLDVSAANTRQTAEAVTSALHRTLPVTGTQVVRGASCGDSAPLPAGTVPAKGEGCRVEPVLPPERECPLWRDGVAGALTDAERAKYATDSRCRSDENWWSRVMLPTPLVDDGSALPVISGGTPGDLAAATDVLRDGGVVVGDPRYLVDGTVTLAVHTMDSSGGPDESARFTAPGYAMDTGVLWSGTVILGDALAGRLEMRVSPVAVAAATSRTPTEAEQDAASAAVAAISGARDLYVERGAGLERDPVLLVLALIAGVVTLGASAIATGLVLADSRRELSVLAAVGAAPRLRRSLTLAQSGVIAGLGTLVGGVVGLGAAGVTLLAMNSQLDTRGDATGYPFVVPWQVLGITVVVPLIAMLGAGLFTRSRLPVERRLA